MKKSAFLLTLGAAMLALTGCAANKAAAPETMSQESAAPAQQTAQQSAPAAGQKKKLDGTLCLFNRTAQVNGLSDLVLNSVSAVVEDVQNVTDPKNIPQACQKGYVMVYGLRDKPEDKTASKTAKTKKPADAGKSVDLEMLFVVLHNNRQVLTANGPLSLVNGQLDGARIQNYALEMTNALVRGYEAGTLGKEPAPAARAPAAK